jgi:hypothetical protein
LTKAELAQARWIRNVGKSTEYSPDSELMNRTGVGVSAESRGDDSRTGLSISELNLRIKSIIFLRKFPNSDMNQTFRQWRDHGQLFRVTGSYQPS